VTAEERQKHSRPAGEDWRTSGDQQPDDRRSAKRLAARCQQRPETDAFYRCRANDATCQRYWRYRNTGPRSFRLGRRVLYRRSDLHDWIAACHDHDDPISH
jgi:hypothetical protein